MTDVVRGAAQNGEPTMEAMIARLQSRLTSQVPLADEAGVVAGIAKPADERRRQWRETLAFEFGPRSEEHTSELQSLRHLVCRLLLEKKKKTNTSERDNTKITYTY